jgi:RteC protein.
MHSRVTVYSTRETNVKEVMSYFQSCFKVDKVANYYGYFQGMRIRKKDRTPFLNGLIEHTIRRMDESDEFPRFS